MHTHRERKQLLDDLEKIRRREKRKYKDMAEEIGMPYKSLLRHKNRFLKGKGEGSVWAWEKIWKFVRKHQDSLPEPRPRS